MSSPIESISEALSAWQSFYTIVGSSAGALIGLQFVVIALIPDKGRRATTDAINAFGTPTVVHFSQALALSAFMCMPWRTFHGPSIAEVVLGLAGLAYGVIVFRRARRQTQYNPESEDWAWYTILPWLTYACMTLGAILLLIETEGGLFLSAVAALGLLFVGIHNAWDTVIYIVTLEEKEEDKTD